MNREALLAEIMRILEKATDQELRRVLQYIRAIEK